MRKLNLILLFIPILILQGCGGSDSRTELENYVKQIKARPSADIEPLPQIKPYETFTYHAGSLRSPFTLPLQPNMQVIEEVADNGIRPDTQRRRELLETYPIDALRMVGTMEKESKIWAVIIDKEGAVHRVKAGNYVGLNHGKINKITEEKLFITEIIPNPIGGWQERQAEMALTVEEE